MPTRALDRKLPALLAVALTSALACLAAASVETPSDGAVAQEEDLPTLLFVQDAKRGTFRPAPKPGQYWLTLHGVPAQALWFENRPGSRKGTVPNRRMMRSLFKPPVVPPNAAIDAWDPKRQHDVVMGVKILGWKWFAVRNVMRYRVEELRDAPGAGSHPRVNSKLPRRLGETAIFIDDFERSKCRSTLRNQTSDTFEMVTNRAIAEPNGFHVKGRPGHVLGRFGSVTWLGTGGNFEGCYTQMTYVGPRGSVTLGLDVPLFGSNDWNCTTTGNYKCTGPVMPDSHPYGYDVKVHFDINLK